MRNYSVNPDHAGGSGGPGGSVSGAAAGARGVARAVPVIGGFVLFMAAVTIFGILMDRPSVFPWGWGAMIAIVAVLAVAGVALIVAGFVWPRPLTDDERRAIERAGKLTAKATAKERFRARLKFFAAAGLLLVWGVSWTIGGGIRYGWTSAEFRSWAATGVWALVAAAFMIIAGLLSGRGKYAIPVPRDDERERLIKLKAGEAAGLIMYVACLAIAVLLFSLSAALDSSPLMYVGLGFLGAVVLYCVISVLARRYYDSRL